MHRATYVIVAFAAIEGLAGVALAGAAAHVEASPLLTTASQFLMVHAAVALGLAALGESSLSLRGPLTAIIFSIQAGVALFSADLAARALGPGRLFPFAAPIGGTTAMLAWAALVLWALWGVVGRRPSDRG